MHKGPREPALGRAPVILAAPVANVAVLSSICVQSHSFALEERIVFGGEIVMDERVKSHVQEDLLPMVDSLCQSLGVPPRNYTLTSSGIAAASAKDVPVGWSGHSADLSVLLAMASCALEIPLRPEVAGTGRIVSIHGEIAMVGSLAAKILAAANALDIMELLYPHVDTDHSMTTLIPEEKARIEEALFTASERIRLTPLRSIEEAYPRVLGETDIVLSSLRLGYYGLASGHCSPIGHGLAAYFLRDLEKRFWRALEEALFTVKPERARELIEAFLQYHARNNGYPQGAGLRLHALLSSIPPLQLYKLFQYPLISLEDGLKVGVYARPEDHADFVALMEASIGKNLSPVCRAPGDSPEPTTPEATLELLLRELDAERMAAAVTLPIDDAKRSFVLDRLYARSAAEFRDTVTAFYMRVCQGFPELAPKAMDIAEGEALALVERAFAQQGGYNAACREACNPTRAGGLSHVIDVLTTRWKLEIAEKRALFLLKNAVDPLDYGGQLEFTKALLDRLRTFLPDDIADAEPEDYVEHWEPIVRAYVRAIDSIGNIVQTL